jgi:membrane protein implicated in regulation of membrane protease activity
MNETVAAKVAAVPITIGYVTLFGYSLDTWVSILGIAVSIVVLVDYSWKWARRLKTPIYTKEQAEVITKLES